jgi:tight adherence protein C
MPVVSPVVVVCLALLAVGVFVFVESLPFGVPRPSLADELRSLDPEYWAHLADRETLAPHALRVGRSLLGPLITRVGEITRQTLARLGIADRDDLAQSLELLRPGVRPAQYMGEKVLIGLVGLLFLPAIELAGLHPWGRSPLWLWMAVGVVGYLVPDWDLRRRRIDRRSRIVMELPSVLSMLVLMLTASRSLEEGLIRVTEGGGGELARELRRVRDEVARGQRYLMPALQAMAERNGVPELTALVSQLRAASDLGLSLTDALRAQAATLRERKRMHIVSEGGKGTVRMVIPVAIFILPVLFVIVLAPAAANLASWGA